MEPVLSDVQRRRRRRGRISFRNKQVPIRLLLPNLVTLIGLCAGLTAIRMAIEGRYDVALGLIVLAALIDGIDGRIARMLKAQSRFGAELDSLADFVNFGVAPAIVIFTWGLGGLRSFGWIVVMVFALACGLRLARFNAALDEERPRWQSNYFTGMPAPAGAITVLLPLYLDGLGFIDIKAFPQLTVVSTLAMAFLMVSTIPTFSGKLAGERIGRDYIPLVLVLAGLGVAFLLTYPYITMAILTAAYLCLIPLSYQRFQWHLAQDAKQAPADASAAAATVDNAELADKNGLSQPLAGAADDPLEDQTRH